MARICNPCHPIFKKFELQQKEGEDKEQPDEAQQLSAMWQPQSVYFYHPDHLGTSTYLSDRSGNPYQFFLNLPFGETMAEQHSQTEDYETPYKFNGKELDSETGYYYYGARYYDPKNSIWISVDPLMEKYPSINPYVHCVQNPIKYVDVDGRDWVITQSIGKDGTTTIQMTFTGKLINQSSTAYSTAQMNGYASRLSNSIKKYYESASSSSNKFIVNVTVNISVASSNNPLSPTDHAINIVDDGKIPDPSNPGGYRPQGVIGLAAFGELGVYINKLVLGGLPATTGQFATTGLSNTGAPTLKRTGSHEGGHTATLEHPNPARTTAI